MSIKKVILPSMISQNCISFFPSVKAAYDNKVQKRVHFLANQSLKAITESRKFA